MKRIIFFFSIITLVFSCAKDDLTKTDIIDENTEIENRGQKIDVCHNGHIIRVSINAVPAHQAHGDAVDMDGDGYFDKDNVCGPTDCDDNNTELTDNCEVCPECPFGEYLSTLDASEYCYEITEIGVRGHRTIYLKTVFRVTVVGIITERTRRNDAYHSGWGIPNGETTKECYDCASEYIMSKFIVCPQE
ncbi:MAG: hypothetical protein KJO29_09695 [Bacteroidia bacterium]|nr:hypothetical protein [Bacteroidia bacterium]